MIRHPITVDDREPKADDTANAIRRAGGTALVGRLPFGDFRWGLEPEGGGEWWSVVIERKTMGDLLASVEDGRLTRFFDLSGGIEPPPNQIRALLVEGTKLPTHGRTWTHAAVDNLLAETQMLGIVVLRCGVGEVAERLVEFWRWSSKDDHRTFMKPALPQTGAGYLYEEDRDAVRVLMTLPGFGEELARRVLKEMPVGGALGRLYARDYKAFKDVRGVAKGKVDGAAALLGRMMC